ncbi:MAG: sterol desaturase family protein [Actinomycetota bacterium]
MATSGRASATTSLPIDKVDLASGPIFVATMLWEAQALKKRRLREFGDLDDATSDELSDPALPADPLVPVGYEKHDTRTSLLMLAGNVAVNLALAGVYGKVTNKLYARRLLTFTNPAVSFAVTFVAWDFVYYWSHRFQHERRLMWANHVTHHSSERYNLSTALRQPWQGYFAFGVYAPMPLLGMPAHHIAKAGQLNLLYQYWIHTELIDKLPAPVEAVFNTPSHHRVHHGANPQYIDKNYGGILILWDKLFGTFEPEVRRVKYGLTKNVNTFNPIKVGYHETVDIVRDAVRRNGWRNKVRSVLGRTGWQPDDELDSAA